MPVPDEPAARAAGADARRPDARSPDVPAAGLTGPAGTDAAAALHALRHGTTPERALRLFDALPPALPDQVLGAWAGDDLPTGGPLDGVLPRLGWHGKRVDGAEDVHPLIFRTGSGRLVDVDPGRIPLRLALRLAPLLRTGPAARAVRIALPLLATSRPRARLRTVRHRGVATAALVYDALPVVDALRRVDDETLLGAMDLRGATHPYLFVLRRERGSRRAPRRTLA